MDEKAGSGDAAAASGTRLYYDDDDAAADNRTVRMKKAWKKARVVGFIRLVEKAASQEKADLHKRILMLIHGKFYSKKKAKEAGTELTDKDLQPFDDIINHYKKKYKKEQEDAKLPPPRGGWDTIGELSPEEKRKLAYKFGIPPKEMVGGRKRKRKTRRKKRRKSRKKRKTRRKKKRKKRKTKRR
jgi:hypothetical protein